MASKNSIYCLCHIDIFTDDICAVLSRSIGKLGRSMVIATARSGAREQAIEWASDDQVIGQLFDKLEAARNAA